VKEKGEIMKRHRVFGHALVIAGLVFGSGSGAVPASASDGGADADPASEWWIETAVSDWNVGPHLAVATDPETGETFISYYDHVNGDLYLARTGAPGPGNCGPSDAWTCLLLDSAGDVGQYNSIAVGGEGPNAMVWISYYDATNAALKAVRGLANRPTGEFEFTVHTIDTGNSGTNLFKGKHTAVVLNPTGYAHIAYQYSNLFSHIPEAQLYARQVAPNTGNCGEGDVANDWQCDLIFNEEGVGEFAAIDIVGYEYVTIAFYDSDRGYPFVATYAGSGGNCGPSLSWLCRTVEHTTFDTGKYLSLYIEDSGAPHLAYYNETDGTLEYATFVNSGGNCGFSSASLQWEWQCDWIDDIGSSLTSMGIAIEEDNNGYPIIAYQDVPVPIGPAALKVARPYAAVDWNPNPNCGPIVDPFYSWVCEMMDDGGSTLDEADAVSIALDSGGGAVVAYRELDSYPFPAEGAIKVAREAPIVFFNGFDSGDFSYWSAVGP
jgi:hypothetical protein